MLVYATTGPAVALPSVWSFDPVALLRAASARYARPPMGSTFEGTDASARREHDRALVQRVLAEDAAAQGELLERLLPHLRVVSRAILRNPADVDDGVQVALMRVLEGLPSYRGDSSLVRWARRVASRACLRLREQNQRRLSVVEPSDETHGAAGLPPAEPSLGEGLPRHVAEYLERLPQAQREALVLRHVLDHTVAEIAEIVGAPVDTVKSRLLYARRSMRAWIRRDTALPPRPREGAER